jgi:hypothetical protein
MVIVSGQAARAERAASAPEFPAVDLEPWEEPWEQEANRATQRIDFVKTEKNVFN